MSVCVGSVSSEGRNCRVRSSRDLNGVMSIKMQQYRRFSYANGLVSFTKDGMPITCQVLNAHFTGNPKLKRRKSIVI